MSPSAGSGSESWIETGDGTRLFARRWPAVPPRAGLLMVHGLGDHSGRHAQTARILAGKGVTVLAPDLRGHGRSPGRRGDAPSMEVLLSDLDAGVDALRSSAGDELPRFLFGHSLGGLMALLYAMDRSLPDLEGLLVCAPWVATRAQVPGWKELLGRILARIAPGVTLSTGMEPRALSRDPEWIRAWREDPLVHDRISARLYRMVGGAQERVRAGGLNLPSLFLVPEDDPLVDSGATRELAEREGADLRTFPGFRHEPFGEVGREAFFQAVSRWISAHLPRERVQNPRMP